jgi:hypothetical protein
VDKDTKEIFVPELSLTLDSLNKSLALYGLKTTPIEKPIVKESKNIKSERPITKVGFSFYNNTMEKDTWLKYTNIINESNTDNMKNIITEFIKYSIQTLKLSGPYPKIMLTTDKTKTPTYGHYDPNNNTIVVYTKNRSTGDILRTIAHELIHRKQESLGKLGPDSGTTGSPQENQANSIAGIMLRNFGKEYPEIFE